MQFLVRETLEKSEFYLLNILFNPGSCKDQGCCHSSIYIDWLEMPRYSFCFILDDQVESFWLSLKIEYFLNKVCENSIFFSCLVFEISVFFLESPWFFFQLSKHYEPCKSGIWIYGLETLFWNPVCGIFSWTLNYVLLSPFFSTMNMLWWFYPILFHPSWCKTVSKHSEWKSIVPLTFKSLPSCPGCGISPSKIIPTSLVCLCADISIYTTTLKEESFAVQPDHIIFVFRGNKLSRWDDFGIFRWNKLLWIVTF